LWLQVLWIDLARRIYVWNVSEASLSDYFFISLSVCLSPLSLSLSMVEENAK
jgi:hypothetical protein